MKPQTKKRIEKLCTAMLGRANVTISNNVHKRYKDMPSGSRLPNDLIIHRIDLDGECDLYSEKYEGVSHYNVPFNLININP